MSRRCVAVTGVGAVSPFGLGVEALHSGLREARSALTPLSLFESPLAYKPSVGEINVRCDIDPMRAHRVSRTERLAIAAAAEAFNSVPEAVSRPRDCATVVSTTFAGLTEIYPAIAANPGQYYRARQLGRVATYPVGHVADAVAQSLDIGGIRIGVSIACVQSQHLFCPGVGIGNLSIAVHHRDASRAGFCNALQEVALSLWVDRARRDGEDYSDRPPGTAFLAAPAVWLGARRAYWRT